MRLLLSNGRGLRGLTFSSLAFLGCNNVGATHGEDGQDMRA